MQVFTQSTYDNMTNEQLITQLQRTQRERDFYKNEYTYTRKLASNASLDPTDKWCVLLSRWVAHDTRKPLNEPTKMFYEKHAPLVGLDPKTVGRHYMKLAESEVVERTMEKESDGRDIHKHVSIALTDAVVHHPEQVFLDTPRNRGNGQKNFICKSCGSASTKVKRVFQVTCMECGEVHIYDPQKPEDKAFIVDDETAENWQEWYGDVDVENVEACQEELGSEFQPHSPQLEEEIGTPLRDPSTLPQRCTYPAPERACIKCGEKCWTWNEDDVMWRPGCD